MSFLKVIVALSIAFVFVIFFNNIIGFGRSFSGSVKTSSTTFISSCSDSPDVTSQERALCNNSQNQANQELINRQWALVRAGIILVLALIVAIKFFRRYPFLAGGLMIGGIMFLIFHPSFSNDLLGPEGASISVIRQSQIVNGLIAAFALVGLIIGDVLFFEKDSHLTLTQSPPAPPANPPAPTQNI